MKTTLPMIALALAFAGCASNEAQLASRAKVTRAQSEATALKRAPGGKVMEVLGITPQAVVDAVKSLA